MTQEVPVTNILVVEDNPMDVRLLRYSFEREPEWKTRIEVAEDGEQAIERVLSQNQTKPDLVILDLNLPKRDGAEVLRLIRGRVTSQRLPVIVFSSAPEDVIRSRVREANLAAECYVTKPVGIELFSTLAKRFRRCYDDALRSQLKNFDN
jgi:CheY-like chemotaxis protein